MWDDENGGRGGKVKGTHRPRLRLAVYIIISSYDYFAFCLSTGAHCSVKAQKLTYYFRSKPRARTAWATFFKLSPRRLTGRVRFATAKLISLASIKNERSIDNYHPIHGCTKINSEITSCFIQWEKYSIFDKNEFRQSHSSQMDKYLVQMAAKRSYITDR